MAYGGGKYLFKSTLTLQGCKSKAKIILWEESGAFDAWKLAVISRPSGHTHLHIKALVWGSVD